MADEIEDAYLVTRANEGYVDAFEVLVQRHAAMAFRVAFRMLGDRHDAQDVAQEALLTAWRMLPRFRGDSSFSTWLYRIVSRQALNRLTRGKTPQSLNLLDDMPSSGGYGNPHVSAETRDTQDAVNAAVAALPLPQRLAIVLHYFEGLPYEQVAEITHSSTASVRSHLYRARRTLTTTLAEQAATSLGDQGVRQ